MDTTQIPVQTEQAAPQMSDTTTPVLSEITGSPEPQQPQTFDAAEREALLADKQRVEAELAQTREQTRRYEQQMAAQAAQAWKQEEARVTTAARDMDPDDALRTLQTFYNQREAALVQTIQQRDQALHNEQLNAWIDHNIKESGLSENDKQQLLWVGQRDPEAVPAEAQRLANIQKSSRSEVEQLRQKVEQLERAQQAGQMRASGAWQTGGAQPQPVNPNIVKGSRDHLKSLLGYE